jgi:dTDP-4-dehydrorhamnose 3,5-epimerase
MEMFEISDTPISGVRHLKPRIHQDSRGEFVKTFHAGFFLEHGMEFRPMEQFFSVSSKDVLRGLHFQRPPAEHAKLVFCTTGKIQDVVVDLRASENYGRVHSCELTAKGREMLFIPKGCAHGFLTLEQGTTVFYLTDAVYDPANDDGILWSSINLDWRVSNPILSNRDGAFQSLGEFSSPFA